ncbi:MAG: TIGR02996 domain-containing protein [Deltaproteobacteria bacterium]|nr:TIGR02996 domain-containing protein [Deltaproteobacteria bacterium]
MSEQQRKIRFVRRLTEAPMRACIEALEQTGGDEIEAAKLLRTPEQNVRDRAWLRAREVVRAVEGGPPSASELALQEALEGPLRLLLQVEPARDGYPRAWTDALAQAALEGRSDAFLVFADWLQEQGDPRGELIVLQHHQERRGQSELSDEERRLLGASGALGDLTSGRWSTTIEWHLGFVQSLHSVLDRGQEGWGQRWLADLSRFLAHPSCLLLRSLSIGRIGKHLTYGQFAELAAAQHLPLLDTLSFGAPRQRYRIGELDPLGALPALRQLTLRGEDFPQHLPELQITDLTLCLNLAGLWHALQTSWPQVQSLRIEIPSRVRALGEEAIDRSLTCFQQLATALPALRRLELDGGSGPMGRTFEEAVARSIKQAGSTPHLELVLVSSRERRMSKT